MQLLRTIGFKFGHRANLGSKFTWVSAVQCGMYRKNINKFSISPLNEALVILEFALLCSTLIFLLITVFKAKIP